MFPFHRRAKSAERRQAPLPGDTKFFLGIPLAPGRICTHLLTSYPLSVPEPTTNEEIARLHRRRQELKEQSEQIEKRLDQLQTELKKVTGRIVLPDDARRE